MLRLLGCADGHLVETPSLLWLDKIGVKPRGQTGDLGHGGRQPDALFPGCPLGQVTDKREMSSDRPGKAVGRCALLKLAVAERCGHEQLLVAQVRALDRRDRQDAERSAEELPPVRVVLLAGVI